MMWVRLIRLMRMIKDPKDGRNGDTISIKEKINQIKSKTNDSSIKTICDTLLKDVTKLEKLVLIVNYAIH